MTLFVWVYVLFRIHQYGVGAAGAGDGLTAVYMRRLARRRAAGAIVAAACAARRVRYMRLHACLARAAWHVAWC